VQSPSFDVAAHSKGCGNAPLSFAENLAAMVLFGLIIALAARSQFEGEKS
jgi:hypothetical protein